MIADLLSRLADWLPLGYAFGAGMIATVNPCGFLMLPAYVAYYLGTDEGNQQESPLRVRGLHGLALGLAITLGFVVLFSTIGLAVSLSGQALL
ncbi:MAG: cytochrome c biogenesis protein CcdA, partial [Dehalococcoidia bacterium]